LARRKGKKERVTPEFGERKEEKNLPPNSERYIMSKYVFSFFVQPRDLLLCNRTIIITIKVQRTSHTRKHTLLINILNF
jgi:hypothetical protein